MSTTMTPTNDRALVNRGRSRDSWTAQWLTRLFFNDAQVQSNEALAPDLHRITLQGPSLRGLLWSPGDKLQIKLGRGMLTRTYTPIYWDNQVGRTAFIAHTLTAGPGSDWVRQAAPGDTMAVFGPRASLALTELDPSDSLLVGDETTLSLAAAWRPAQILMEATLPHAVQAVAESLALPIHAVGRLPGDTHWPDLVGLARASLGPATSIVLAGRAATVQHLLRQLKQHGVAQGRIRTKAYWANGKAGMD